MIFDFVLDTVVVTFFVIAVAIDVVIVVVNEVKEIVANVCLKILSPGLKTFVTMRFSLFGILSRYHHCQHL